MRAFIALELPEGFADEVAGLSRQLQAVVEGRFVVRELQHITMAFLGEIGEAQAVDAIAALEAACDGAAPVPLHCEGLGKFGRPQDATLWLGLAADPALVDLAGHVRKELAARGLPFDDKPFKPHITLARRARLPRGALPVLPFPGDACATTLVLFRSTLSKEGPVYKKLFSVELGPS